MEFLSFQIDKDVRAYSLLCAYRSFLSAHK